MAELVNYMEKMVFNKLEEVMASRKDICRCEHCRLDIVAIALNNLSPRYIVTDRGKLYAKLDTMETQFGIDVLMALGKAINIVHDRPRHQEDNK